MPTTPPGPTFTKRTLEELARKRDPDFDKPEVVYRFSNGREFKSTDRTDSGIYKRS